jgi:hypothetical protein
MNVKKTGCDYHKRNIPVKVMTATEPLEILGAAASVLEATVYQGDHDRNHKLLNIGSTDN